MVQSLISIFERDLDKLTSELNSYNAESNLWVLDKCISNSGGTLALHICGNLLHFIGSVLGSSGYIRQRKLEFSRREVPLSDLLAEIQTTRDIVTKTLSEINPSILYANYPINVFGKEMSVEFFLMHLSTHLSYHLGQINYHRRLLDV